MRASAPASLKRFSPNGAPRSLERTRRINVAKRKKKKKSADRETEEAAPDATAETESAAAEEEAAPGDAESGSVEEAPVAAEADDALQADEPVDEPTADVVSADPAGRLAEEGELHAAIEALLFTSPDPLSANKLARALGDIAPKQVREALTQLAAEYEEQGRGFCIVEVAGGYQMATQERFSEYILRLGTKKKQSALSGAMLETLAIIAYRQPVIRAVVESIRGVESSGVVRNLLDLGLIEVVGRKEVIGRPQMYGTTEKFLRSFGLRNLKDLPSIRGLREKLEAEEAEAAQKEREAEATDPSEAETEDEEASEETFDETATDDDATDSTDPDASENASQPPSDEHLEVADESETE